MRSHEIQQFTHISSAMIVYLCHVCAPSARVVCVQPDIYTGAMASLQLKLKLKMKMYESEVVMKQWC